MTGRHGPEAHSEDASIRDAMEWFERVHGEDVDTELLVEWHRWLADCEAHQLAFRRVEDFWRAAGGIKGLSMPGKNELKEDDYDGSIPVTDWRAQYPATQAGKAGAARSGYRLRLFNRRRLYLFVAAVVVLAVLAALFHRLQLHSAAPAFSVFETGHGEHREVVLSDGSKLSMGARSSVSVNYTDVARNVVVDYGEAFFTVVAEKSWPFIVRAGVGTITAVGTAFNVQNVQGRVVVTVTEGSVDVANVRVAKAAELAPVSAAIASTPPAPVTRVQAGQQVAYGKGETAVGPTDSEAAVAWRAGRLKYRGEALKFVIPDVARYTDKQLVIADPAVGELRFTGTVFQDDVDDWLASLGKVFPIELMTIDSGTVVLRTRRSEPAQQENADR